MTRLITIPALRFRAGAFDVHFTIPPNMESDEAIKIMDEAVAKVKEKEDFTFEDLEDALVGRGFSAPLYVTANARW